ncbi:MAG: hypothetical protein J0J15_07905, partial [Mesorhizobium sp.]|nr:hypothetical protein [Mesorhizobium sp.]
MPKAFRQAGFAANRAVRGAIHENRPASKPQPAFSRLGIKSRKTGANARPGRVRARPSDHRHAAVDMHGLAGDVAGLVRG